MKIWRQYLMIGYGALYWMPFIENEKFYNNFVTFVLELNQGKQLFEIWTIAHTYF